MCDYLLYRVLCWFTMLSPEHCSLLIISERYAFSPKFESECQGGYAAGNALRKYAEGFEMPFITPAAHARVAGPEQERVALRTVKDSGKALPRQQN